ncbi:hypothetical protein J3Q64DRAFT_1029596 [Phycomyces blakesleeanus]|uniref:RING-type E3 ubiquitin transferase n=1 Tax=Phycomyces blakesleeanus TaxID=4837 RepID=A0ABR3BFL8_PHYBL
MESINQHSIQPESSNSTSNVDDKISSSKNTTLEEDDDESMACAICSENWTGQGSHCLASLECGHLFGQRNPFRKSSVRVIRPTRIAVHDETDILELKRELQAAQQKSFELARDLEKSVLAINMCKREFTKRNISHTILDTTYDTDTVEETLNYPTNETTPVKLDTTLDTVPDVQNVIPAEPLDNELDTESVTESEVSVVISDDLEIIDLDESSVIVVDDYSTFEADEHDGLGSHLSDGLEYRSLEEYSNIILTGPEEVVRSYRPICTLRLPQEIQSARTMALMPCASLAVVGMKHNMHGHGIQKVNLADGSLTEFIPNHTNSIRDIKCSSYGRAFILSTGLDKTLVLSSIYDNTVVERFQLEAPGWSCNFDDSRFNIIYCGLSNGVIVVYDILNPQQLLYRLRQDQNIGPIHSLYTVSIENQYRIMCSSVSGSVGWSIDKANEQPPVCRPLIDTDIIRGYRPYSLFYQPYGGICLLSSRNRHETYHIVGTITNELEIEPQWSFISTFPQHNMARTTIISEGHRWPIVAFANETNKQIVLRNREGLVQVLEPWSPVMDIKHCLFRGNPLLAALTLDTFELYSYY